MTSAQASDSLKSSAATPSVRIVGVLTCFNRKPMTLACLSALHASAKEANVELQMIVVDDASSDGTAAAVRAAFPQVEVIDGSGALFWNRGMHQGYGVAMQRPADYYLWINDDSHLVPDAIGRLLRQSVQLRQAHGQPVIVVGAMAERGSGRITYGGRVAGSSLRRFNYRMVWSPTEPIRCDVIEGNCVLIPRRLRCAWAIWIRCSSTRWATGLRVARRTCRVRVLRQRRRHWLLFRQSGERHTLRHFPVDRASDGACCSGARVCPSALGCISPAAMADRSGPCISRGPMPVCSGRVFAAHEPERLALVAL